MQIKQQQVVLSTSLRELLASIVDFVKDVYINDLQSDYHVSDMIAHIAYLQSPQAFKKALRDDTICCGVYFDMALIERFTSEGTPFTIEVLDDDGNVWATFSEEELGSW